MRYFYQNVAPLKRERKVWGQTTDLLERIIEYVDANLAKKVTLKLIAEEFGVSVSTVTQLFQRRTGGTFHQYLTNRRMEAAVPLIRDGVPLEEVGRRVGYNDHSSFYRAFCQHFGMPPREYRQKLTQKT